MQNDFRPPRPDRGYDRRQYYSAPPQPVQQPEQFFEEDEERPGNVGAKVTFVVLLVMFVAALAGGGFWVYSSMNKSKRLASGDAATKGEQTEAPTGLELIPGKNYGNRYADGKLPLGDEKYVTDGAKKGYVYMCKPEFAKIDKTKMLPTGPWMMGRGFWNAKKKSSVSGNEVWQSSVHTSVVDDKRTIQTNALPNHPTGKFPSNMLDPAFMYDRNPYPIKNMDLSVSLDASPEYSETPACMGNEAGIMLNGVVLLNAFDQYGRDAEAWEMHDTCGGHPYKTGIYHYHTRPKCFKNVGVDTVLGFALDGFPITGAQIGEDNYLTTADLDECHGIVSDINLDGKRVRMYHYVLTRDFPYSVSCFRNAAAFTGGGGLTPSGGGVGGQSLNVQGGAQVQSQLGL